MIAVQAMHPFLLCGFACSGKSTIGKLCAEKFGIPFYDTDHLIENAYGQQASVSKIWEAIGEESFRELERKVVFSLKKEFCLVALGGGSLNDCQNCSFLKQLGKLIYLKAPLITLYQRLLVRGLPSFLNKEFPFEHLTQLSQERFPIYENMCDYMIETDNLTENESANRVWEAIVSGKFSALQPGENLTAKQLVWS
jgi:shikimate kinase